MTRKEALHRVEGYLHADGYSDTKEIIKALEQESILDKIRAEIMQIDYDTDYVDYDYDDMPQTEIIHTVCREEVFQIIDKYKAESEGQKKGEVQNEDNN